jgi:hypothetical protein
MAIDINKGHNFGLMTNHNPFLSGILVQPSLRETIDYKSNNDCPFSGDIMSEGMCAIN